MTRLRKWISGAVLAVLLVIGVLAIYAYMADKKKGSEVHREMILSLFNDEEFFTSMDNSSRWTVYDPEGELIAYAYFGTGEGYEGPVRVLTLTDPEGNISKVYPYEHEETPSYFAKLYEHSFIEQLEGHSVFTFIEDQQSIDVISGATRSCEAIIKAIRLSVTSGSPPPQP